VVEQEPDKDRRVYDDQRDWRSERTSCAIDGPV
jgi:hypothetical protein